MAQSKATEYGCFLGDNIRLGAAVLSDNLSNRVCLYATQALQQRGTLRVASASEAENLSHDRTIPPKCVRWWILAGRQL
ncbi:MAG: hypothetical protein KME52_05345 [Desmonostoc geniculatum HA4340-LM1]|nr:hypothetical protein [Desmonostoc geniculatum HA4340-LM1]